MKVDAIELLLNTCLSLEQCVSNIRYCEWPTKGLGIGLHAEELDELINQSQDAINRAKRILKKEKEKENSHQAMLSDIEKVVRKVLAEKGSNV